VRIAYLILAHNQPAHLQRLVQRLAAPGVAFFVHVDAKSDINAFAGLAPAVTFCARRVNCGWGDISLVHATLALLQCAAAAPSGFDRFVLLSGACYPLQHPAYIEAFFRRHRDTEFIQVFGLPNVEYNKSLERIRRVWIRKGKPLARLRWPLQRVLNKILPVRDYQTLLGGGQPVVGSQWWCLSHDAVRHVLEVTTRQPALLRFCKFVDVPDEFYFQFILWNSRFQSSISHSLTLTHWVPGKTGPEAIGAHDLPQLAGPVIRDSEHNNAPGAKGEVLFARKFSDASTPVLDAIDALAVQRHRSMGDAENLQTDKARHGQN
jgi:hypothetical protein